MDIKKKRAHNEEVAKKQLERRNKPTVKVTQKPTLAGNKLEKENGKKKKPTS